MRYFALLSILFCAVAVMPLMADDTETAAPVEKVSAADKRAEKKDAALWYKDYMDKKKKAATALKKVKDEKSAAKAVKLMSELYGLSGKGKQTAMGEVGEAKKPENPAIDELMTRNEKKIEKLNAAIEKEKARIDKADLLDDDLNECIEKAYE